MTTAGTSTVGMYTYAESGYANPLGQNKSAVAHGLHGAINPGPPLERFARSFKYVARSLARWQVVD